jgi:chromosome segregation ATPase
VGKVNKQDVQIIELREQFNSAKQQVSQTQNQLGDVQKTLLAEQQKNTNLQAQLDRMRSLVENLDSTKEELLQRL